MEASLPNLRTQTSRLEINSSSEFLKILSETLKAQPYRRINTKSFLCQNTGLITMCISMEQESCVVRPREADLFLSRIVIRPISHELISIYDPAKDFIAVCKNKNWFLSFE